MSGGPPPALTLNPRWPLLAVQGTSLLLEAVGQTTPSSRSRPVSWVELCGDRQEASVPVWPPRLGRTPSCLHPDTPQRKQHLPPPGESRGMRLQGLGVTPGWVRGPQEPCFPPAHRDIRVTLKGSRGTCHHAASPSLAATCPHIPGSLKLRRRGWGSQDGWHRGPSLACAVLPDGAS